MKDFRQRLREGPILCDGAMGTLLDLYEYPETPHEIQNLRNPDIVERIHREYIAAGAEIIQTNTFSANLLRLAQFHLEDRHEDMNRAGVEIARRAAGNHVYVAGSVGPTGRLLEPVGKIRREHVRDIFRRQIEILVAAGVDLLILETFVSLSELDEAIAAAREVTRLPVVAQKTFPEDGSILSGSFPLEVVEHLAARGVDVIGANCTVGPQRMFTIIRNMYKDGVVLSAQPAAGIPTLVDGRSIYHATPEYLAQYARQLLEAGVTLIGACCGSTPSHIEAIRKVVEDFRKGRAGEPAHRQPETAPAVAISSEGVAAGSGREALPERRSRLSEHVKKKFLVTVELDVPRGFDMSSVTDGARYLAGVGVDAINITDGARARLRISPVTLAHQVQTLAGMEAVMHLAARDRNLISLQSELMSAHLLGIRNVLCVTGDPTRIGDYPQATSVFDVDSIGLIRAAQQMNQGRDLMGNDLGRPTAFFIACAVNPVAGNIEGEMARLERKLEAGAHIVFTQPLYELTTLEQLVRAVERWAVPVMLGILPLRGARHAEFLHNEIPGMRIPEKVRQELRSAGDRAAVRGVELAISFLREARSMVAGVYLMPPFRKYEIVPQILEGAGIPLSAS